MKKCNTVQQLGKVICQIDEVYGDLMPKKELTISQANSIAKHLKDNYKLRYSLNEELIKETVKDVIVYQVIKDNLFEKDRLTAVLDKLLRNSWWPWSGVRRTLRGLT